jgi:hypothetical protein
MLDDGLLESYMNRWTFLALLALAPATALVLPASAVAEDGEVTEDELSGRNLTTKQKRDFAAEAQQTAAGYVSDVGQQANKADQANDTVLLNCLNDKHVLLQKVSSVIGESKDSLDTAISGENDDDQEYYFRRIFIAAGESDDLYAEAQACVNSRGFIAGGTQVQVKVKGGAEGSAADTFGSASDGSNRGGTVPPDASPAGGS